MKLRNKPISETFFWKKRLFCLLAVLLFLISQSVLPKDEFQLLAAESKGESTSIERQRSVLRLLNRPDPKIINQLIHALSDPDPLVRHAAAWTLNPSHMDILDPFDYKNGVSQITLSNLPQMETALVLALTEVNHWVKLELINALVALQDYKYENEITLNESVMGILVNLAKDPDPDIRAEAIYGLPLWKENSKVRAVLHTALKDEDRFVRRRSLASGIYDLPILAEILATDSDHEVRVRTVGLLAKDYAKDPRTFSLMIKALHDPHFLVIREAVQVLGNSKDSKAIIPLLDLHKRDKGLEISMAIKKITGKALDEIIKEYELELNIVKSPPSSIQVLDVSKLVEKIQNGNQTGKIIALNNISIFREPEAVKAVLSALNDAQPRVRYTAMRSLTYYISPRSEHLELIYRKLISKLDDSDPFVRRIVVPVIGNFTWVESFRPRLFKIMSNIIENNYDPFVLRNAIAFPHGANFPEPASSELYLKLVQEEFFKIRKIALSGIRLRCHPERIQPVIDALGDPLFTIRYSAVGHLEGVGFIGEDHYRKVTDALEEISKKDRFEAIRNRAKESLKKLKFERPLLKKQSGECGQINM